MTRAWLFNLEAEDELAAWRAGLPWRPDAPSSQASRAREALAAAWPEPDDHVIDDARAVTGKRPTEMLGAAWMPTPSALERLARAGASLPPAPPIDVLAEANARETHRDLARLPGALTAWTADELVDAVVRSGEARAPGVEQPPAWLVRPSLTSAGRARLVVDAGLDTADAARVARLRAFARTQLPGGPLDVAPLVDVAEEFALHGRIEPDGALRVGVPLRQRARGGAWTSSSVATDLVPGERAALEAALVAAADRLRALGYFGPFGIDALAWIGPDGVRRLHAPLEVNARYGMAYRHSGLPL